MNLTTRLFLILVGLVTVTVGLAIAITWWAGSRDVEQQATETLVVTQSVQQSIQSQEVRNLELVSALMAADRAFVAYVAQALTGDADTVVDTTSIGDLLDERSADYDFDLALVLDLQGRVVVQTGDVLSPGRNLANRNLVGRMLDSFAPDSALWVEREQVFRVAAVPLVSGREVQAILVTGTAISSDEIEDIAEISNADLAYVRQSNESAEVLVTTLPFEIAESLAARLSADPAIISESADRILLELGNESWLARVVAIGDATASGALVSLVPESRLFQGFIDTLQLLLIAAAIAVIIALLVALLLSRQFLQPIQSLTRAASDATEGRYQTKLDAGGPTEISRLKSTFNRLIGALRENSAVDAYFQDVNKQRILGDSGSAAMRSGGLFKRGDIFADRYRILERLGEGGMGSVYLAEDQEVNEPVALKTLSTELASSSETVAALKSEMRLSRRVTHPNVVKSYDFSEAGNIPFITMEYVRGVALEKAILQTGRVNPHAAMRFATEICAGVAAAHAAGVIHGDLKPANVMVSHHAKVMDFGIAYLINEAQSKEGNATFQGTPAYLSPEQLQGSSPDERSDIYAMGILLTEMFTGHLPHTGTDTQEIFRSHLERQPRLPSDLWSDIDQDLEAVILRCLERQPQDRWDSVEELLDQLSRLRGR